MFVVRCLRLLLLVLVACLMVDLFVAIAVCRPCAPVCLLFDCCLLFVVLFVLFVCLPCAVCCLSLFRLRCSLFVVRCALFVGCCLLIASCLWFVVVCFCCVVLFGVVVFRCSSLAVLGWSLFVRCLLFAG